MIAVGKLRLSTMYEQTGSKIKAINCGWTNTRKTTAWRAQPDMAEIQLIVQDQKWREKLWKKVEWNDSENLKCSSFRNCFKIMKDVGFVFIDRMGMCEFRKLIYLKHLYSKSLKFSVF